MLRCLGNLAVGSCQGPRSSGGDSCPRPRAMWAAGLNLHQPLLLRPGKVGHLSRVTRSDRPFHLVIRLSKKEKASCVLQV